MKKILALLAALVMVLACASVFAEGEMVELYKSDFTAPNMDGWAASGWPVPECLVDDDGCFVIYNRSNDWDSVKKYFNLQPGAEYKISVEVYQDTEESAVFSVTFTGDEANWRHLAEDDFQVPKGEWTLLEGVMVIEETPYSQYALYVETPGFPKLDFKVRNFTIYGAEGTL